MTITPIAAPRPVAQPGLTAIEPPSLQPARDGDLRVVVWFGPGAALPDDEVVCTEPAVEALFGPGVAQRLLMTPATAWLWRLFPGPLAETLDRAAPDRAGDDVVLATPYARIYLLRLTGGLSVAHVCAVLGACAHVALVYPEPTLVEAGAPVKYQQNDIFKGQQAYLKNVEGINAEPAWAKGYTGSGVQAAVVDSTANFDGLPFQPRQVAVPAPAPPLGANTKSQPGSLVSTHGALTSGILGSPDQETFGIGAAPEVSLLFAAVAQVGTGALPALAAAMGALLVPGQLNPGDVVNISIAVQAGLDIKHPYAGYADLLTQRASLGGKHLVTEPVGGGPRPSAVATTLPLEFEPSLLKLIADLTAQGVTVVVAAGNGMQAFYNPGGVWFEVLLGADLSGPWRAGALAVDVAAFRRGLGPKPPHSLDRATPATFADGGAIVVSGGQLSPKAGGMIDNIQLNHGNRVDCYVGSPSGQALRFVPVTVKQKGGSSLCAPVIAGAAAVLQGMAKTLYAKALRPAIVRALLSDPGLGTPTVSGSAVGVMPDLEKLMTLLEATRGKPADLTKAVAARQAATAAVTAKAAASGTFVHDPYTAFSSGTGGGRWQPLALASASDLFVP